MNFDNIEAKALKVEQFDVKTHLESLSKEIKSTVEPIQGYYQKFESELDNRIANRMDASSDEILLD